MNNSSKGGDFMEQFDPARQAAIERAMQEATDRIEGLRIDEVSCMYKPSELAANDPDEGRVLGSVDDPTFPKVVDRTRDIPPLEVPDFVSPPELRSEQNMTGGE